MLRKRLFLPLAADRWLSRLLAPMVVMLAGSALLVSLPQTSVPLATGAALTSGGKFAARVPGAEDDVDAAAGDARASTPARSGLALSAALDMASVPLAEAAAPVAGAPLPAIDRPGRPQHLRLSHAGRRAAELAPLPIARPVVLAMSSAASGSDEGLLPRLATSVRSVWSVSAAAGSALLSRIAP